MLPCWLNRHQGKQQSPQTAAVHAPHLSTEIRLLACSDCQHVPPQHTTHFSNLVICLVGCWLQEQQLLTCWHSRLSQPCRHTFPHTCTPQLHMSRNLQHSSPTCSKQICSRSPLGRHSCQGRNRTCLCRAYWPTLGTCIRQSRKRKGAGVSEVHS
jgi:hypothetical protein